jgi:photosystem II PsbM protein
MVKALQLSVLVLACASMAAAFAPSSPALHALRAPSVCNSAKLSPLCAPRVQKSVMSMSLAETGNQAIILAGGMQTSTAGFLAVILGTFIPVVFLITLFIQSEARKAAESGQE